MFLPSGSMSQESGTSTDLGTGKGIIYINTAIPSDFLLLKTIVESDNPCKYKGRIIYIEKLVNTYNWPDPFLFEDKFYFNENCEWFESPFLNGVVK